MAEKKLPFENSNVWEFLIYNSYLSEKYKLLYISTPKVACTSLKWWFADLEGYAEILSKVTDSRESGPDMVVHDSFRHVAPGVAGLGPDQLAKPLVSDEYFRFAVVRNPYKRIFSAWQSKLLLREPIQSKAYAKCDFFHLPLKTKGDIALAFEGFLEHLSLNEAPNYIDYHWTPQVNLLRPDLITYNNISQIEDTQALSQILGKYLGPNIPDPFTSHRVNESLIPYLPFFITKRSAELIRALYVEDFQTFGYDHLPPQAKAEISNSELEVAIQAIGLIRGRHQRLGEMFEQIVDRNEQIVARNEQIVELNQAIVDRNEKIVSQDGKIAELAGRLDQIYRSRGWKFLQGLRKIRHRITGR
jgi:hypothetical protein